MSTPLTRREFLDRTAVAAAVAALAGRQLGRPRRRWHVHLAQFRVRCTTCGWPGLAKLAAQGRIRRRGLERLGPAETAGLERDAKTLRRSEDQARRSSTCRFASVRRRRSRTYGRCRATGARGRRATRRRRLRPRHPPVPAAPPPSLDEAAAFASAVGCRKMMAVLPTTSADTIPIADFRKTLRDQIAGFAETLAKYDLRLGLEFLGPLQFRTRPNTNVFIYTLPAVCRVRKRMRTERGRGARRLALAPFGRNRRRYPRHRQVTHRPGPPLGRRSSRRPRTCATTSG